MNRVFWALYSGFFNRILGMRLGGVVGDPGWPNRVFACVAIELVYYWNHNMAGGNGETLVALGLHSEVFINLTFGIHDMSLGFVHDVIQPHQQVIFFIILV